MSAHALYVRAVIFDMDGVITDTMGYHVRAMQAALREAGVTIQPMDVLLREGMPGEDMIRQLLQLYDHPCPADLVRRLAAHKEKVFGKLVKQKFVAGSRAFTRRLKRQGLTLALVSGSSSRELKQILPESIRARFDVVVTGDDGKRGKPAAEPYCLALDRLKLSPTDAVVVENAPLGVESAHRAGLRCIALTTTLRRTHFRDADWVCESYRSLENKLSFYHRHN